MGETVIIKKKTDAKPNRRPVERIHKFVKTEGDVNAEKDEKDVKAEGIEKAEKDVKAQKIDKAQKDAKAQKIDKAEKDVKAQKEVKIQNEVKAEKVEKAEKDMKAERIMKAEKDMKAERIKKAEKDVKAGRVEKLDKVDNFDAWPDFQTALKRVITECARQELNFPRKQGSQAAFNDEDIRKTVTNAVMAVLTEASLLEKVLKPHMKSFLEKNPPPAIKSSGPAGSPEEVKKIIQGSIAEQLPVVLQKGLGETIRKEVKSILSSNEIKEMIDSKFRMISVYLKTDVIPKAVQQELARNKSS